jgi:hypothetical protein
VAPEFWRALAVLRLRDVLLGFGELDGTLKISQVSLRLLDLQQSLMKFVRRGARHLAQRAVDRSRASQGILRAPIAMFQTLHATLSKVVIEFQIERHGLVLPTPNAVAA